MTNLWHVRFDRLHDCQTRQLGVDIRATVTGFLSNARAVLSGLDANSMIVDGGMAETGGYEIQVKTSDVTGEPAKGTAATVNGAAQGKTLEVISATNNGGVWLIQLGDFAAR